MTITLYRWAKTPDEAADLQRDGWTPCEGSLRTHHAEYALLHKRDEPDVHHAEFGAMKPATAPALHASFPDEMTGRKKRAANSIRNGCATVWTDEVISELERLWDKGFTCAEIARHLGNGISRNAVIGKVTRLHLPGRNGRLAPRAFGIVPPPPRPRIVKNRPAPIILADAPPSLAIPLIGAGSKHCRYPTDGTEGESLTVCGHETIGDRPWCAFHRGIVYDIASTSRSQRAAKEKEAANV